MWVHEFIFWLVIVLLVGVVLGLVFFSLGRQQYGLMLLISVLLPLIALLGYWKLGAWHSLRRYWLLQQEAASVERSVVAMHNPQHVVEQLQHFLQQHPHRAKGWYLLGKLYLHSQSYKNAQRALARAIELAPQHPSYQTAYAEAVFFANGNHLSDKARTLLIAMIHQHPHQLNAINLLALDAYNQQHYVQAIHYWEQISGEFPPQSREAKLLYEMIAKAQRALRQ